MLCSNTERGLLLRFPFWPQDFLFVIMIVRCMYNSLFTSFWAYFFADAVLRILELVLRVNFGWAAQSRFLDWFDKATMESEKKSKKRTLNGYFFIISFIAVFFNYIIACWCTCKLIENGRLQNFRILLHFNFHGVLLIFNLKVYSPCPWKIRRFIGY
jgi:hypothetical protein